MTPALDVDGTAAADTPAGRPLTTIAGILRLHARQSPEAVAVVAGNERLSWRTLHQRACRVANALAGQRIGPGDRVAFMGRNGLPLVEYLFGCALLNAVPVPINWRLTASEVDASLRDAAPKVFIVEEAFAAAMESAGGDGIARIVVNPAGEDGYAAWRDAAPATDSGRSPAADDVALQLYTSGTTGRPKAILLSAENVSYILDEISKAWHFDDSEISLVCMPLFHSGGLAWLLAGMAAGARQVLCADFDAEGVLNRLEGERVTRAMFIPAMLSMLVNADNIRQRTYSLKQINYTGSPITERLLRAAITTFRCNFVQTYGLTEATGAFVQLDVDDHDPSGPRAYLLRSAGRAYPWVEIAIVRPGTLDRLATGDIGEIIVRSGQNMLGYWNRPEETAKAFAGDGWMRTGDGGYIDPAGYLFVTDRLKDVIISGGENVYPAEVENVLASHPGVAEVSVIGVPSERWGETVKAVVAIRPGETADAGALIAHARARLAHFKCPTSVDFVDALPRNATGKVLKNELRARYWKGHGRNVA